MPLFLRESTNAIFQKSPVAILGPLNFVHCMCEYEYKIYLFREYKIK